MRYLAGNLLQFILITIYAIPTCILLQVSEAGVHRPHVAGIAARENEGAFSIVLSGGYEDDVVCLVCLFLPVQIYFANIFLFYKLTNFCINIHGKNNTNCLSRLN